MLSLATVNSIAATRHMAPLLTAPSIDALAVTGFLGSILTLLFWMHQRQSRSCVAGLSICLAVMAIYGFMQGAWPLGILESVWSVSAFQQWRRKKVLRGQTGKFFWLTRESRRSTWHTESRISRMFGHT
jgi:hypothetical protein